MKYINKIIIASFICFGLMSCESFLELQPKTELSEELYYKTSEQFEHAVNGAYSTLQESNLYGKWYIFSEIPSDNTHNVLSGSVTDQDEFDKFYLRTTNPHLAGFWNDSYKAINRVNTVLDRIDGIEMNNDLRDRLKLECKFLRGLLYFNLVRVYGDIPLVLREISITESYDIMRSPVADIYTSIINDITAAEELPVSYTSKNDIGRATSGAAKALLGDIYLTLRKYPEAESKLKEVVDSKEYQLLENTAGSLNIDGYAKYFHADNHNNKEAIFEIQFKKGGYEEGNPFPNDFAPENSGDNVVALGGTGGNNLPELEMYHSYENGDLRRDFSMALGYINKTTEKWIEARYIRKYFDIPYKGYDANNNYPVIRYADILLKYAEALNQNGKTTEACKYLNMIRRRGFGYQTTEVSPYDINTTSKDEFFLKIEHERRVELAFEGHRWFDLLRTERAITVMTSKGYRLNKSNLVYPIPQKQMDVNPKLTQNDYIVDVN